MQKQFEPCPTCGGYVLIWMQPPDAGDPWDATWNAHAFCGSCHFQTITVPAVVGFADALNELVRDLRRARHHLTLVPATAGG